MRRRLTCLLVLGLMLGVSACKPSDSGGGADGQMVRYAAFPGKIKGLDPMNIQDTYSAAVGSNIYDCLYAYHYLKRPEVLIPNVATDMPKVSEDGLTYTIRIRDDVYFHDDKCFPGGKGRKLVVQDYIYSWKRIADIKNVSGNWPFLEGKIKGLDEFREYTKSAAKKADVDYDRTVEGLEAVDDHTLRITLVRPWPQILFVLAHLPTAAVPHEAVAKYGDEMINHAVGTGPYMLESWVRGNKIVLVRNPNFREEFYPTEGEEGDAEAGLLDDAGKRIPFIDRVEMPIIEEDQPYWLTFMNGELDSAGIPKDNFAQAVSGGRELSDELKSKGIRLQTIADPSTFWVAFNMQDPVVGKNLPLRRAMSLAIDRHDYIELFLNGRGMPARGLIPPGFYDYNENLNSPYTVYDPAKARQLVREAEKVHGGPLPKLELMVGGTDTTQRQMGEYLVRAWTAIGLKVEAEFVDWPTLQREVDNKSAQMFPFGWLGDYPDAENFLMLYYGPNESPGPNHTNYKNPEFDRLFEKASIMPMGPERREIYQQLEQMIVDDLPNIFDIHRVAYILTQPWLKNYKFPLFGNGNLKYQKIDVEMRRQRVGR